MENNGSKPSKIYFFLVAQTFTVVENWHVLRLLTLGLGPTLVSNCVFHVNEFVLSMVCL